MEFFSKFPLNNFSIFLKFVKFLRILKQIFCKNKKFLLFAKKSDISLIDFFFLSSKVLN